VKGRKSKALGVLYDHRCGIGDVDSYLNYCRRDKHVDFSMDEVVHNRPFFFFPQSGM
jgi:hypothetical protein